MAASDYDYQAGRGKILERAFRIVGALPLGSTLSGAKLQQGSDILNTLLSSWQSKGILDWSLSFLSANTVIGSPNLVLSLDPKVLSLEAAYVVDTDNDIRIDLVSYRDYLDIQDKASTGRPNAISFNYQDVPVGHLYPVPDKVYTVKYVAVTKVKDYDETSSTRNFQTLWERAVVYGVAADLADEYGLDGGECQKITAKAVDAFQDAEGSMKSLQDNDVCRSTFSNRRFI